MCLFFSSTKLQQEFSKYFCSILMLLLNVNVHHSCLSFPPIKIHQLIPLRTHSSKVQQNTPPNHPHATIKQCKQDSSYSQMLDLTTNHMTSQF